MPISVVFVLANSNWLCYSAQKCVGVLPSPHLLIPRPWRGLGREKRWVRESVFSSNSNPINAGQLSHRQLGSPTTSRNKTFCSQRFLKRQDPVIYITQTLVWGSFLQESSKRVPQTFELRTQTHIRMCRYQLLRMDVTWPRYILCVLYGTTFLNVWALDKETRQRKNHGEN